MNWRSKKLTQSAKHESCVACGANDGTIVWAHSNSQKHGKGMGIKAHDLFGAYLCHRCHKLYDEYDIAEASLIGKKNDIYAFSDKWHASDGTSGYHYKNRTEWFHEQWEKSMIRACEKGYL